MKLIFSVTSGVSFDNCWENRDQVETEKHTIPVIGREQLIANKQSTGRTRDKADVEALENNDDDG